MHTNEALWSAAANLVEVHLRTSEVSDSLKPKPEAMDAIVQGLTVQFTQVDQSAIRSVVEAVYTNMVQSTTIDRWVETRLPNRHCQPFGREDFERLRNEFFRDFHSRFEHEVMSSLLAKFETRLAQMLAERESRPLRVDLKEICRLLNKSESTIRRWMQAGLIPYEQLTDGGDILFDVDAVDKALKVWRHNALGTDSD